MKALSDGDDETFCYVGKMPGCECVGVVTVDKPEYTKDNSKTLAQMIRDGLIVERMTVAACRKSPKFGCERKLKMKECRKQGLNIARDSERGEVESK